MRFSRSIAVAVMMLFAAGAQPKYPPKTARMIFSDDEIKAARENVKQFPAAKKVADEIVKQAEKWAALSDDELISLITSSEVPRAFETGTAGCPKCGHALYEKFGQYGWLIDPKMPFKVKCPNCGSIFPSNDYAAYYRSGFKEKIGCDTAYVDDGWGWQSPNGGEKFWFVAFYNHWMWYRELAPAVKTLGRAYLLTGDKKYAHKAECMLRRMSEVYPAMDHAKQSRYGSMMAKRGIDYPGKVVNAIWECGLVSDLAEAYDDVFETIADEKIRADIEANILEEGIAAFPIKVRGNFGMHQSALVNLGLARQFGEQDKWFDGLLQNNSPHITQLGLHYALYNLIYRDGVPSETAPGYNFIWVEKLAEYGELLKKTGRDVFKIPKTKRLFDAVIDQINARKFTPSEGDSGNIYGAITGQDAATFQTAYREYRDPRYANFLASFGAAGDAGFKGFESLLHPPIDAAEKSLPPQRSRLLAGYGMAILNNPADTISLSLYYGLRAGHGAYDRLNFELFANGQPIMPNLGYPDAMNEFVPGIYTWSKNTISHQTVTVDASKQSGNVPGVVHLFADSPSVRVVDVDGNGTYSQCSQYRRAMIMIDVDKDRSYFVDIFDAAGGKQHDYSLHGPPGNFEMIGGEWSSPAKGTLAGENVALHQVYDNATLGAKGYSGGYGSYAGSGFQHLFNVQTHTSGRWVAQWRHEKDEHSQLRVHILEEPGQQIMLADAHVSPVKYPAILKYLVARRTGEKISSRFTSVLEPFKDKSFITSARRVGEMIEVQRNDGETDQIFYHARSAQTDADVAVITLDRDKKLKRVFFAGGSFVTCGEQRFTATGSSGIVTSVDPPNSKITIKFNEPEKLVDRIAHFSNEFHQTVHPIASQSGDNLITRDDLFIGRFRIDAIEKDAIATHTTTAFPEIYRGVTLASSDFAFQHPVHKLDSGKFVLAKTLPPDHPLKPGEDIWLVNVGVGDKLSVPAIFHWSKGN